MPMIGRKIGEFTAKALYNGDFIDVSNTDLEGKWSAIVFYPADFSFVCPTELSELADLYEEFQKVGCEIYSVSTDSHFVHKAWADASDKIKKIKYPMISDTSHIISKDFGVLIENDGMALRGSFILNPKGEVVAYEINSNAIGRNANELLRKVQAAQFASKHGEQVCPASWKPGAETLKPSFDLVGKI